MATICLMKLGFCLTFRGSSLGSAPSILPREAPWGSDSSLCSLSQISSWRHPSSRVGQLGFRKEGAVGELTPSDAFSRWGNCGPVRVRGCQWSLPPPAFAQLQLWCS